LALAKFGLERPDIHPCINLFKGTRISPSGDIDLDIGPFPPGRTMTMRAEMDILVVFANCPHPLDPRTDYRVSPVTVQAWKGPVTPQDDPIRQSAPEATRAFLNTEDYYQR
jgi:uncharacterized protein YcgI (DUF1989 family)